MWLNPITSRMVISRHPKHVKTIRSGMNTNKITTQSTVWVPSSFVASAAFSVRKRPTEVLEDSHIHYYPLMIANISIYLDISVDEISISVGCLPPVRLILLWPSPAHPFRSSDPHIQRPVVEKQHLAKVEAWWFAQPGKSHVFLGKYRELYGTKSWDTQITWDDFPTGWNYWRVIQWGARAFIGTWRIHLGFIILVYVQLVGFFARRVVGNQI